MFFLEYICSLFEFSSGVYKISLNLCFYAGISEGIFLQKEGRIGLNSYLTKSIIYIKKKSSVANVFFSYMGDQKHLVEIQAALFSD